MLEGVQRFGHLLFRSCGLARASLSERFAGRHLTGSGLEVAAADKPLRLGARARVTYVDRLWPAALALVRPDVAAGKLVPVGLLDDCERLGRVPDGSQDFVVANRFLTHCDDPLGAVANFVRVLKDGGALLLAVPDRRWTPDRCRPAPSVEHLLRDQDTRGAWSRRLHMEEHARLVIGLDDEREIAEQVAHLEMGTHRVRYHVWSADEFRNFVTYLTGRLPVRLDAFACDRAEVAAVLRKRAAAGRAERPRAA